MDYSKEKDVTTVTNRKFGQIATIKLANVSSAPSLHDDERSHTELTDGWTTR